MKYFLLLNLCLLLNVCAFSQGNKGPVSSSVAGHIFKPEKVDVKDEYVKALKVPQGFKIEKFAEDLGKPRMMAVSDHGYVYVSRRNEGDVMLLKDENDDDIADLQKVVAKIEHAHGLTINNGKLYIAAINKVYEADINEDGTLSQPKIILDDLPDGGQHANRTIDFGPDGLMYITVGSMCNACDEANPESAAILQVGRDFKNRNVYASGLRNTIGFDWHPETGELYGMDHGIDWLGDEEQKEELNKLDEGGSYGWPYIYADGKKNLADKPSGMSYEDFEQKTTKPVLLYEAHSAPLDMVFYDGQQFPQNYRNNAFVTMHGSWNRAQPSGYKVVMIKFKDGKPEKSEDFVTGFLVQNGKAQFGRVCGLALLNDGPMLISDDDNGVIYGLSYTE